MSCGKDNELELTIFAMDPDAPEVQTLRTHVESCAECQVFVSELRRFESTVSAAFESQHLSAEDLMASVDGGATAERRAATDEHIALCALCRSRKAALIQFDGERSHSASTAGAAGKRPWWQGVSASPLRWLAPPLAVAAAAVALMLVIQPRSGTDGVRGTSPAEAMTAPDLRIESNSEGPIRIGDPIAVEIRSHQEAYISLVYVDSAGTTTVVSDVLDSIDWRIEKGGSRMVSLGVARAPVGRDTLLAIASTTKPPPLHLEPGSAESVARQLAEMASGRPAGSVGVARIEFEVAEAGP